MLLMENRTEACDRDRESGTKLMISKMRLMLGCVLTLLCGQHPLSLDAMCLA